MGTEILSRHFSSSHAPMSDRDCNVSPLSLPESAARFPHFLDGWRGGICRSAAGPARRLVFWSISMILFSSIWGKSSSHVSCLVARIQMWNVFIPTSK